MRLTTSALPVLAIAALSGCTAQAPAVAVPLVPAAAPAVGELWPGQRQAVFDENPSAFLAAARAACNGPGQSPVVPSPRSLRCETLPTPDIAATLILLYGGTVEALPVYVVSFTSELKDEGYVVTADSYVVVPRADGTDLVVRLADPEVEAAMTDLLAAAGGRPL